MTLWFLWLACTRSPAPATDTPRWVSLSPAVTETIATLDREDVLVGRSEWCSLPKRVTHLPAMGSALTPHLEPLAQIAPTRILVDDSHGVDLADLERIAPVQVLPWLTVQEVATSIETLGQALGRPTEATTLAARMRALDTEAPAHSPEVLLTLTADPRQGDIWYVRTDSLHGAALAAAGGRNVVREAPAAAPSLSLEGVLGLSPDAIIVLVPRALDADEQRAIIEQWSTLKPLQAGQRHRIGVLAGPEVMSPGPSILPTTEALRAELQRLMALP